MIPSRRCETITLFSSGLQKTSPLFPQVEHGALWSNVQRPALFFAINKKGRIHEVYKNWLCTLITVIRSIGDIFKLRLIISP